VPFVGMNVIRFWKNRTRLHVLSLEVGVSGFLLHLLVRTPTDVVSGYE
jgi:hypothetical protein